METELLRGVPTVIPMKRPFILHSLTAPLPILLLPVTQLRDGLSFKEVNLTSVLDRRTGIGFSSSLLCINRAETSDWR